MAPFRGLIRIRERHFRLFLRNKTKHCPWLLAFSGTAIAHLHVTDIGFEMYLRLAHALWPPCATPRSYGMIRTCLLVVCGRAYGYEKKECKLDGLLTTLLESGSVRLFRGDNREQSS